MRPRTPSRSVYPIRMRLAQDMEAAPPTEQVALDDWNRDHLKNRITPLTLDTGRHRMRARVGLRSRQPPPLGWVDLERWTSEDAR